MNRNWNIHNRYRSTCWLKKQLNKVPANTNASKTIIEIKKKIYRVIPWSHSFLTILLDCFSLRSHVIEIPTLLRHFGNCNTTFTCYYFAILNEYTFSLNQLHCSFVKTKIFIKSTSISNNLRRSCSQVFHKKALWKYFVNSRISFFNKVAVWNDF